MISNIQNNGTSQTAFTAHIPNTLGKKACDKLAKKFLASNDEANIAFAKDYFTSLEKIKNEKNIEEVIIRNTDRVYAPDVWCDGVSKRNWDFTFKTPKGLNYEEERTSDLMKTIMDIANDLPEIITRISNRR